MRQKVERKKNKYYNKAMNEMELIEQNEEKKKKKKPSKTHQRHFKTTRRDKRSNGNGENTRMEKFWRKWTITNNWAAVRVWHIRQLNQIGLRFFKRNECVKRKEIQAMYNVHTVCERWSKVYFSTLLCVKFAMIFFFSFWLLSFPFIGIGIGVWIFDFEKEQIKKKKNKKRIPIESG